MLNGFFRFFLYLFCVSSLSWAQGANAAAPVPLFGWNVDCGNHCFFSDLSNNCQGVYFLYPDGTKSYSSWSSGYNACQEFAPLEANTHIITKNEIQCNCPAPSTTPPSPSAALTAATRTKLELLRAQVEAWTLCTPDPMATVADPFTQLNFQTLNTCQYFRKHKLAHSLMSVGGCYSGELGFLDNGWHPCNYSGDLLSDSVNNCVYGDVDRCLDIKNSQDPVSGMWYRNPNARKYPQTSTGQPLFSRDALDGLVAYINASHDKEALRKWLIFVEGNGKSPPLGLFNICPARPSIPQPSEVSDKDWAGMLFDDRCGLEPVAAGQVYQVAIAAGLTNADLKAIGIDLYSVLTLGYESLNATALLEAGTAPALGDQAYQIMDDADSISVSMNAGGAGNSTLIMAAQLIDSRTSFLNPGNHFLAMNQTPTEYGAYLIGKYCKGPKPTWGMYFETGWPGQGSNSTGDWYSGGPLNAGGYQFAGGFGTDSQKAVSYGHECIAWLDMYLGNGNYTELQCALGDTLVNGACRKFAFPAPTLAAVPGLDYKIRTSDAKINYMAIDTVSCPYGGTFEPAQPWPGPNPRCSFPSGLLPGQLTAGVNYMVDPTEAWPGISYRGTGGKCPNGGSGGIPNCQLMSYSSPVLSQSVHYWVDATSSAPGVYYQKINGACSAGGTSFGSNCLVHGFAPGFLNSTVPYFARANPEHPGIYYEPQVIPERILSRRLFPVKERFDTRPAALSIPATDGL